MIAPTELRIGVWVNHNYNTNLGNGYNFQWKESDWLALDNEALKIADLYPIPLTSEILEKARFLYRVSLEDHYINVGQNSVLIIRRGRFKICASNQQPSLFERIEYLHQLQNLYFALTGQELEINLP